MNSDLEAAKIVLDSINWKDNNIENEFNWDELSDEGLEHIESKIEDTQINNENERKQPLEVDSLDKLSHEMLMDDEIEKNCLTEISTDGNVKLSDTNQNVSFMISADLLKQWNIDINKN